MAIFVWVYFWILFSVPLIYVPDLVPLPYCLDYCNSGVISQNYEPPNIGLHFQNVLSILASLPFHVHFRISDHKVLKVERTVTKI